MSTQADARGSQTNQPSLMLAGFSSRITQVAAGFVIFAVLRKFRTGFGPVGESADQALIGFIQQFIDMLRTQGAPPPLPYGSLTVWRSAGHLYTARLLT